MRAADKRNKKEINKKERKGGVGDEEGWVGRKRGKRNERKEKKKRK